MRELYFAVYQGGEGEIIEKKSRFIATVSPVFTEQEAENFINNIRKHFWNATHNCSAYIIGEKQKIQHCSDDGEPNGTAGKPMLDVLVGKRLSNVVVVVTRYFGGTLLGTGGLVRAYSRAVQAGLENSILCERKIGKRVVIQIDYNSIGKLQYLAKQQEIPVLNTEYAVSVIIELLVPIEKEERFLKQIKEVTAAKVDIKQHEIISYGEIEGKIVFLEER